MARVKKGISAHKRRKNLLRYTKGFRWTRKSKYRLAKEALLHAWTHSYTDRKKKKREFRNLWQIRINASIRKLGMPYNKLIHILKEKKVEIDRKIMADLAENNPEIFEKIVKELQK